MSESIFFEGLVCPVPIRDRGQVIMGHGSGGKLSHDLITSLFLPPFDNPVLRAGNDAGVVEATPNTRLAISTDSHVVWPLFFPGGDIGRLAVCGTVNDVAMMGAKPHYLTAGFILEEGLELALLEQVVESMRQAAVEAGVEIIAGDTKVVERGKADGLFINTTGIGRLDPEYKAALIEKHGGTRESEAAVAAALLRRFDAPESLPLLMRVAGTILRHDV